MDFSSSEIPVSLLLTPREKRARSRIHVDSNIVVVEDVHGESRLWEGSAEISLSGGWDGKAVFSAPPTELDLRATEDKITISGSPVLLPSYRSRWSLLTSWMWNRPSVRVVPHPTDSSACCVLRSSGHNDGEALTISLSNGQHIAPPTHVGGYVPISWAWDPLDVTCGVPLCCDNSEQHIVLLGDSWIELNSKGRDAQIVSCVDSSVLWVVVPDGFVLLLDGKIVEEVRLSEAVKSVGVSGNSLLLRKKSGGVWRAMLSDAALRRHEGLQNEMEMEEEDEEDFSAPVSFGSVDNMSEGEVIEEVEKIVDRKDDLLPLLKEHLKGKKETLDSFLSCVTIQMSASGSLRLAQLCGLLHAALYMRESTSSAEALKLASQAMNLTVAEVFSNISRLSSLLRVLVYDIDIVSPSAVDAIAAFCNGCTAGQRWIETQHTRVIRPQSVEMHEWMWGDDIRYVVDEAARKIISHIERVEEDVAVRISDSSVDIARFLLDTFFNEFRLRGDSTTRTELHGRCRRLLPRLSEHSLAVKNMARRYGDHETVLDLLSDEECSEEVENDESFLQSALAYLIARGDIQRILEIIPRHLMTSVIPLLDQNKDVLWLLQLKHEDNIGAARTLCWIAAHEKRSLAMEKQYLGTASFLMDGENESNSLDRHILQSLWHHFRAQKMICWEDDISRKHVLVGEALVRSLCEYVGEDTNFDDSGLFLHALRECERKSTMMRHFGMENVGSDEVEKWYVMVWTTAWKASGRSFVGRIPHETADEEILREVEGSLFYRLHRTCGSELEGNHPWWTKSVSSFVGENIDSSQKELYYITCHHLRSMYGEV